MNTNTRLELHDTFVTAAVKLAEGNPGAVTVIAEAAKVNEKVDPRDFAGPYGPLLALDSFGIYGPRIWMLYKDCCGSSIVHLLAALRAVQLGLFPLNTLNRAIDSRGAGMDVDALLKAVKEELPEFAKEA